MFGAASVMTLIGLIFQSKATFEPKIPAENWANKDLYYQDLVDGVSIEQRLKNVKNGKYKLIESYPNPHKDKSGKIIIENYKLYREDVVNYGAIQAHKWMHQGKYNLTQEEFEEQQEELKKKPYNPYKTL